MLSGLTFGNKNDLEKEFRAEADREKAKKREEKKQRKKEKKDSKKQKNKQKKDRRKHDSSSDSEGSSGPEDAWQQQQQQQQHSPGSPGSPSGAAAAAAAAAADKPALQREDWMTVPMARSFAGQPAGQQQEQPKPKEPEEPAIVSGIRYMKPEQAAAAAEREEARKKAAEAAAASGGPSGPTSASAGVSWRMKAVARAQQLAKEQGRGLNEVLTERWGSAAEIAKGIIDNAAAEQQRPDRHHHHQQQQQRGGDGPVPHYLSGVRSERASMMKPPSLSGAGAGASKLSWRRPAAAGGGSGSSSAREVGRDPGRDPQQQQQQQQQQHDREQQGHERDRQRDRDGDRDRGSDRVGDRERERQHGRGPGRGSERDRAWEHDRDRDRGRDSERDGHGSSGDRDRDRGPEGRREPGRDAGPDGGERRGQDRRDEGGRGGRGSSRGGGGFQGDRRQQEARQQPKEVVEALKAVAGSINTFSNDGSFMQQFQQQTQPHEQQQQQQQRQRQRSSSADGDREQNRHQQQQQPPMDVDAQDGGQAAAAAAAAGGAADNRSKADLLRAKLGGKPGAGNRSAADALRARLGGKAPEAAAAAAAAAEVVHLPLVDAAGRAAPGAFGRETAADTQRALEAAAGGRVGKRVQRYGADGTRERYFADDDSTDLQTLVKRAKHGDDGMDIDRAMMSNIAKRQRFKETDIDPDAEYDFDAGIDLSDSRRRKGDVQQQAARERQRQVTQFNRLQKMEDKCTLCFKSPGRVQDLTIAVGQSSYLSLMPRGKLVEGHCCILTQEHTPSMRQVDDDTWSEVRNWQKCLINMYLAQGRHVIFMETAMAVGSHRHHALMEAIPVDEAVISKAPMYFKKAMEEAESEWSQHAAKAAISTRDKGLRGSVPPNFPYLYVQFGPSNGYVHVIDDEARFDKNLGRQVLVGLLKLPAEVMHRRAAALEASTVKREAAAFRKQFSPFF